MLHSVKRNDALFKQCPTAVLLLCCLIGSLLLIRPMRGAGDFYALSMKQFRRDVYGVQQEPVIWVYPGVEKNVRDCDRRKVRGDEMVGREGGCRAAGRRRSGVSDAASEASCVASAAEPAAGGAAPALPPSHRGGFG